MFDIRPATEARFDDLCTILAPKKPGAQGCWCLSARLGHKEERTLVDDARPGFIRDLTRRDSHAPGVLAYDGDGEVVGWASVAPGEELEMYRSGKRYPEIPDGTWVLFCLRVKGGQRKRGIATALVAGATDYAQSKGARAVIGYPVDNQGAKVDLTLASAGILPMFERAGYETLGPIDGTRSGMRQVLVRKEF